MHRLSLSVIGLSRNRTGLTYRAGIVVVLYERYHIIRKPHIRPRLAILFIKVSMHPYNLQM